MKVDLLTFLLSPLVTVALIAAFVSYFFNRGLDEMKQETELWLREYESYLQRERRKKLSKTRKNKEKNNEKTNRHH